MTYGRLDKTCPRWMVQLIELILKAIDVHVYCQKNYEPKIQIFKFILPQSALTHSETYTAIQHSVMCVLEWEHDLFCRQKRGLLISTLCLLCYFFVVLFLEDP